MTYLRTPTQSDLYAAHEVKLGYIPNYARLFALLPETYAAWRALNSSVRAGMDDRRYELVTLSAARRLGSRYCTLAHAFVLRERHLDGPSLLAVAAGRHHEVLSEVEAAVVDFAELVAADPGAVSGADFEQLRDHGLSDTDIFQVVLAVAIRRFFAGVLDATGAEPDPIYDVLDPDLRTALHAPR